jgi:hypothetical protein
VTDEQEQIRLDLGMDEVLGIEIKGVRGSRGVTLGLLRLTESGGIRLSGFDPATARFIRRFPTFRYGKRFTIDDGEPWLRELPAALRGVYLWAERAEIPERLR